MPTRLAEAIRLEKEKEQKQKKYQERIGHLTDKGLVRVDVYILRKDLKALRALERELQQEAGAIPNDNRKTKPFKKGDRKQKRVVIPDTPQDEQRILAFAKQLREESDI